MVASGIESDVGVDEIAAAREGAVARDADRTVVGGASSDGDGDSAEAIEAAAGPASGTCIGIRAVDCQARDGDGEGAVVTLSTQQYRALCEQNNALRRDLQEMRAMIESSNATIQQLIRNIHRVTPTNVAHPLRRRPEAPSRLNPANSNTNGGPTGAVSVAAPAASPALATAAVVAPAASARATPGAIPARAAATATPAFRAAPLPIRDTLAVGSRVATLMRNPPDLHVLWHEYEFGIGGNKPAKFFTPQERGSCKYKYYRRKLFWDRLTHMIRNGHTPQSAIQKLYQVHGRDCSVTKIINQLRKDKIRNRRADLNAETTTPVAGAAIAVDTVASPADAAAAAPCGTSDVAAAVALDDTTAVATPAASAAANEVRDAVAAGRNEQLPGPGVAILSRNPRDLHVLWQEYEFGIGGNKPAKYFTPEERGSCKHKYHRRKLIWDRLTLMIRNGYTPQTAIHKLYEVYGRDSSVTTIINLLKKNTNRHTDVAAAAAAASTPADTPVPPPAPCATPAIPRGAGRNVQPRPGSGVATLMRTPRDLHVLWQEYEFGISGSKPARFFTPKERGSCRYMYHRRKVFWDRLTLMIRNGHTPQTAVHKIYEVYGRDCSVTKILNQLRDDRGRHIA